MNKFFSVADFLKKIPVLENKKNKRVAVYTAIFGNYDKLNEPKKIENEIDYFCFTDNSSLISDKWNVILLPFLYRDPRMSARALKILSHKVMMNYDFSVWVDGSFTIVSSIVDFVFNVCKGENLSSFKHPQRDCIYKEARVCQLRGMDKFSIISKQMKWYKSLEYPKNNGLTMSGILVRRNNNEDVKIFNEEWWNIVDNYSIRDQLSFCFILWKYGIKNKVLKGDQLLESFFHLIPHTRMAFYSKDGNKINRIRAMFFHIYIRFRRGFK